MSNTNEGRGLNAHVRNFGVVSLPSIVARCRNLNIYHSDTTDGRCRTTFIACEPTVYETEQVGNTIDRDGDINDNNVIDSLLLQVSQHYKTKGMRHVGKQDDDRICERDHQTRFATPVTSTVLEEVMKAGMLRQILQWQTHAEGEGGS